MTFSTRSDFKDACKRYGLVTFRHIAFDKDEATKIRAKCTWPTCKWSCYASKSSRSTCSNNPNSRKYMQAQYAKEAAKQRVAANSKGASTTVNVTSFLFLVFFFTMG